MNCNVKQKQIRDRILDLVGNNLSFSYTQTKTYKISELRFMVNEDSALKVYILFVFLCVLYF